MLGSDRQRMQTRGVSGAKSGRFYYIRGHHVVPSASFRTLFKASRRRAAHRIHETQETGHRAVSVQCRAGANLARSRSHTARSQQMQASVMQGFRYTL